MLPVRAAQRVGRSGATRCHNSGDSTTLSPQVLLADETAKSRLPVEMNVAAFRFALLRDGLRMVGNAYLGISSCLSVGQEGWGMIGDFAIQRFE